LLKQARRQSKGRQGKQGGQGETTTFAGGCQQIRTTIEATNEPPTLYLSGEGGAHVRLNVRGGVHRIEELDHDAWVYELHARSGVPYKLDSKQIQALKGDPHWQLPRFDRIAHVPIFAVDGSLRTAPGYDPASGVYLVPGYEALPLPNPITDDDVREALYWLCEPFVDFGFSDVFSGAETLPLKLADKDPDGWLRPNPDRGISSFANLLAMILQPFARNLIGGPTPSYHVDKSAPGSGAGFLVNVAHVILTGEPATPQPMSSDSEELRKVITPSLREGHSHVFFDNINHKVDSGPLAAALTSGTWKDRALGHSATITTPIRCVWIMAGNNLSFSHELMRRNVPIRIDCAHPAPEARPAATFKYQDLDGWVRENRRRLVWACHVLIANWLAKGKPAGRAHMASFESYARVMGGILEAAGVPGFLDNRDAYMQDVDEDASILSEVVQLWYAKAGYEHMRVSELLDKLTGFGGALEVDLPSVQKARETDKVEALRTLIRAQLLGRTFEVQGEPEHRKGSVMHPNAAPHAALGPTRVKVCKVRERNPVKYALIALARE
jgi:hypothetical protein